jgi:hypothetical protein
MAKSSFSSIIIAFFFGLTLAAIGTAIFMQGHMATTLKAIDYSYIAAWETTADDAYRNESPQIASWALQRFIDLLTERLQDADEGKYREKMQEYLVLSYARSAQLARQTGNHVVYEKNMASALNLAREIYPHAIANEEELLHFLQQKEAL